MGMLRAVARSLKGKRATSLRDFYKGKKMTLIGAIKAGEVIATQIIEGSMKGEGFCEYVKHHLVPKLEEGDVVVMDNLNSHHRAEIKELIESVGARVEYLPPYSPEFNPIEMMWSQLKSFVRKFRTKTMEALEKVIEVAICLVGSHQLKNWFTKCCYCAN